MSVWVRTLARFLVGFAVLMALLFGSAGTFRFWQAWTFLGVIFVPFAGFSFYMLWCDPELAERRLHSREKAGEQKLVVLLLWPIMIGGLLLCGFDHRWGWSLGNWGGVPAWLPIAADAIVLAGSLLIAEVLRVNSFAGRTIRVEASQKVISTGPYRWVRHPMYSGGLSMWLAAPFALGTYVALPVYALLIPVFILRLLNEEKMLQRELEGYTEYCNRTRYRLAPFVW
jgi:protein-S-isoprenylcysteine O-methyltransferase Ste14